MPDIIQRFEIHMDDNRNLFIPGQKVEGHISLLLGQSTKVQRLRIRFYGKVITHLHRTEEGLTNESSSITMFKDHTTVVGDSDEPFTDLIVGDYVFPFQFRLPSSSLPASFEGTFGSVRYYVTASLILKHNPKKTIIYKKLTVPSTKNPNDEAWCDPVCVSKRAKGGSFWWNSGYFDIQASIPRGGFTSEEFCPITIKILNQSSYGLLIKDINLKQKVTYITIDRDRGPKTEKIHRLAYSEFLPSSIREIERKVQFPIPKVDIIDPDVDTNILKVKHVLDIKLQPAARFSKVIKLQIPIVITGFPHLLFEDQFYRRSVDTLPLYIDSDKSQSKIPKVIDAVSLTESDKGDYDLEVQLKSFNNNFLEHFSAENIDDTSNQIIYRL